MKTKLITYAAVAAIGFSMASCKKNRTEDLNLNMNGLENLGPDYVYEGWIIVDEQPVSTGVFTVNDAGTMSTTTFTVNQQDLEDAGTFVLTIEPLMIATPHHQMYTY